MNDECVRRQRRVDSTEITSASSSRPPGRRHTLKRIPAQLGVSVLRYQCPGHCLWWPLQFRTTLTLHMEEGEGPRAMMVVATHPKRAVCSGHGSMGHTHVPERAGVCVHEKSQRGGEGPALSPRGQPWFHYQSTVPEQLASLRAVSQQHPQNSRPCPPPPPEWRGLWEPPLWEGGGHSADISRLERGWCCGENGDPRIPPQGGLSCRRFTCRGVGW
jgi:hypothetical protein